MHGMQPSSLQDPHQFYLENSIIINTIILSITKTTTVSITMTVKNDRNNSNLRIKNKNKILTNYISTATHCMQPGSLQKPSQCYNHNTTITIAIRNENIMTMIFDMTTICIIMPHIRLKNNFTTPRVQPRSLQSPGRCCWDDSTRFCRQFHSSCCSS